MKWKIKENPAWGKMLDVVADDRDVAFFQREEDAKRCVEAVNSVEKMREALEEVMDSWQYGETIHTGWKAYQKGITALAKEES